MKNRHLIILWLGFLALQTHAGTANSWVGQSGVWSEKNNWSLGHVPLPSEDVYITKAGTYTVTMDEIGGGASQTLGGDSGIQTLDLTDYGLSTVTVGTHGVLNVNHGSVPDSLTNWGLVIYGPDSGGTSQVENMAGAVLDIQGDMFWGGGSGPINNAGTFRRSGGTGEILIGPGITFNNSSTGSLEVQSGSLKFIDGLTSSGILNVANGARVVLGGGTFNFNPGTTFGGSGVWEVANRVQINGEINATFEVRSDVTFNSRLLGGTINWNNSSSTLSGKLTIGTWGVLRLANAGYLEGALTNYGRILWPDTGSASWDLKGQVSLVNQAGGVVEVQGDKSFTPGGGDSLVLNAGTWRKSGGTLTSSLARHWAGSSITFANQGVVEAQMGTIRFEGVYAETPAASLGVSLGGLNPGSQYGRIQFDAAPTFCGKFIVTPANGFSPQPGDRFNVLSYPAAAGAFSGWEGLSVGGGLKLWPEFSETNLTLFTAPVVMLSCSSVGGGHVQAEPAQSDYAPGSRVQLYAIPREGWAFSAWSGGVSGSGNPVTLLLEGDKAVTATFVSTVPSIVMDNPNATFEGTWSAGTAPGLGGCYGLNFRYTPADNGGETAIYDFNMTTRKSGNYDLYTWYYGSGLGNTSNALYLLVHGSRMTSTRRYQVDQRVQGGDWVQLDSSVRLTGGFLGVATVIITNGFSQANRNLVADAVKFSWSTNQLLTPMVKSFVPTGDQQFAVTWFTEPGGTYRLQIKTNLTDTAWTDVGGDVIAAGATASQTDTATGRTQRFYRVLRLE
jgi:hypothetical protein